MNRVGRRPSTVVRDAAGEPVIDPISLNTIPTAFAITLNRQAYDARGLSRWAREHGTVPHSRRRLAAAEIVAIRRAAAGGRTPSPSPVRAPRVDRMSMEELARLWQQLRDQL